MSITFYSEDEAIEYKKQKAEEGKKVSITKVGSKYIAELMGPLGYQKWIPIREHGIFPEGYLGIDKEEEDIYSKDTASVSDINKLIRERTRYGTRTITADRPGYTLTWSNGSARWYVNYDQTKKGQTKVLDANEIFITGVTKTELKKITEYGELEPLPLYGGSFERRQMGTPEYKGELPPMIKVVRDLDLPREKAVDDALLKKHEQN